MYLAMFTGQIKLPLVVVACVWGVILRLGRSSSEFPAPEMPHEKEEKRTEKKRVLIHLDMYLDSPARIAPSLRCQRFPLEVRTPPPSPSKKLFFVPLFVSRHRQVASPSVHLTYHI